MPTFRRGSMKEYLDPRESLENKARDALEEEGKFDADFVDDCDIITSLKNPALLSRLDNSYVALAVYTRFRRNVDDPETLKDVQIFYKNFRRAIEDKECLSGEGVLSFARTAFAVWSAFVQDSILTYAPEEMKELGLNDDRIKERVFYNVIPSVIDVNQKVFDESIRPRLVRFGIRDKVDFDWKEPLFKLVEKYAGL